jgi:hypothetical protein
MAERDAGPKGGRRGQGREQFWREHVGRQAAGSLSVREYCQQHGLAGPTFYIWRKELARRDAEKSRSKLAAPKQPHQTAGAAKRSSSNQFLRVNLEHEPTPSARSVEIVLPDQLRVLVPAGATSPQIREVLIALGVVPEGDSRSC